MQEISRTSDIVRFVQIVPCKCWQFVSTGLGRRGGELVTPDLEVEPEESGKIWKLNKGVEPWRSCRGYQMFLHPTVTV